MKDSNDSINEVTIGFNDNPAEEDYLGCEEYFDGLSEFIMRCPTPMTIAIQGDWGTGKSTAMEIIKSKIESDACVLTFNTWKYAKTSGNMLLIPLIKELKTKIDECGNSLKEYKTEFNKEDSKFVKVLKGAAGMFLLTGRGVIESISGAGNTVEYFANGAFGNSDGDEHISFFEISDKLHEGIQKRIDLLYENTKKRIVIFVDDLDRLEPAVAVNLLEDMKNVMDFRNCVYVLALDHNLVRKGLSRKYGDIEEEYADRFFDKIIQMPFYLPVNKYDIKKYVNKLNAKCKVFEDEDIDKIVELLETFGDKNPRTIKRLLNTMFLYTGMNNRIFTEHKIGCLAINLLQINHSSYYNYLKQCIKKYINFSAGDILKKNDSCKKENEHFWRKLIDDYKEDENGQDFYDELKKMVDGDSLLLKDILMATAVTGGNDLNERLSVTEATLEMIKGYLNMLLEEWERDDKDIGKGRVTYLSDKYSLRITISGYSTMGNRNHVNVTITCTKENEGKKLGLFHESGTDLIEEIKDKLKVMTESANFIPIKNEKEIESKFFYLLSGKNTSICLYNVSVEDYRSLLVTGKILRNIADHGTPF